MDNNLKEKFEILIPIQIDSEDRLNNVKFIVDYYSDFNITIKETGVSPKLDFLKSVKSDINYYFEESTSEIFHKTRVLNDLYKLSKREIVIILDADVIVPKEFLMSAVNDIISGLCDGVYPYRFNKGVFMLQNKDLDKTDLNKNVVLNIDAGYGYCLVINKNKFESVGGENEEFIGYAPEDWERHDRVSKLLKINYFDGFCYHINHDVVHNHNKQPFFIQNDNLYKRIKSFNTTTYQDYIKKLITKYNAN